MKAISIKKVKKFFMIDEVPLLIVILISVVILGLVKPVFMTGANISTIFLGASFELIISVGMTLLFILGGFDLSVGSITGFCGVMVGLAFDIQVGIAGAIMIGLVASALVGLINGIVIARLRVNAMITTLAMQMIVRGLIYVLTKGVGKTNFPDEFNIIGRAKLFGVQSPVYVALILVIVFGILFKRSAWFRQFYFIGGNEEAAKLSGIKVNKLRVFGYTFTGLMSGVAGLFLASRMGGAIPTQGVGMEMNIIAGCVIGGCSLSGGKGAMFGSFLGIIMMAIVLNAFNLLGVDIYWQQLIRGLILIGAVLADTLRRRNVE